MKYDKLVRDKIPEIICVQGHGVSFRVLSESEHKEYLEKKLDEEVAEFHKSKDPEELADIFEVVAALCDIYSSYEKVKVRQIEKRLKRGDFNRRICLIEVIE